MLLLLNVHRGAGYAKFESQVVENSIMGEQNELRPGLHVQSAGCNGMRLSAPAYKLLTGESLAASLHNKQNRSTSCFSATQGELYIIFLCNQAYTTSMRFVKGFSDNMHITGSTWRPLAVAQYASQCHPERSEGSIVMSSEMLRGVYPERSEWVGRTGKNPRWQDG